MTYEADAGRAAATLASIVAAPAAAAMATDVDAIDRTRRVLRQWSVQILDDLHPRPARADPAVVPIVALRALLGRDLPPLRPDRRYARSDAAQGNAQWVRLGRQVEVATHTWATAEPASRPSGDTVWSPITDAAALAAAAAVLDQHLARWQQSGHGNRIHGDADQLVHAARTVRHAAAGRARARPAPLVPGTGRQHPMPAPTLAHLPAALTNLSRLTIAAQPHPRAISALIRQHIPVLEALADALTTGPARARGPAAAIGEHNHALTDIRETVRRLRSIEPDDPRPAIQAQEITTLVRRAAETSHWPSSHGRQAAAASLRPALGVTLALGRAIATGVRTGRWLEPSDAEQLRWAKVQPEHPINDATHRAVNYARHLIDQLPTAEPAPPRYGAPHEVLTPHLRDAEPRRSETVAAPSW